MYCHILMCLFKLILAVLGDMVCWNICAVFESTAYDSCRVFLVDFFLKDLYFLIYLVSLFPFSHSLFVYSSSCCHLSLFLFASMLPYRRLIYCIYPLYIALTLHFMYLYFMIYCYICITPSLSKWIKTYSGNFLVVNK